MKRALIVASLISAPAYAQVPDPYPPSGDMPGTLDPGSSGTQGARPRQTAPAPAAAPQPSVIVVGPDGKVTTQEPAPAESGYYVGGDAGAPYGDQGGAQDGALDGAPVPELHVVRKGDTLWDLSGYYFRNPWEWPKVWSYNPQITNPHWIYPGDLVRLLPKGQFATGPAEPATTPSDPEGGAVRPSDNLPAPARRTEVGFKSTAFVEKDDLDASITIVGAVDEKALLGDGDSVYLAYPEGKPPQVGKRYSIYETGKPVKHGGKELGSYVHLLGVVEVVSVKQDKRARGVIVSANQEIERGAKVGPLVTSYKNVPPVQPKVDAQGAIVGMLTNDQLIGDGEIIFVGLGKNQGLEVGNRMYVVRRGDALPPKMDNQVGEDDRRFPARALGEVVIVDVGDSASVALVTLSVQEMAVGDIVMMQKAQ